jgi:hypothetical protein
MYLLTIRDGLQTRHIGPYETPARAVEDLDALLGPSGERARWQIHELESPLTARLPEAETGEGPERYGRPPAVAA